MQNRLVIIHHLIPFFFIHLRYIPGIISYINIRFRKYIREDRCLCGARDDSFSVVTCTFPVGSDPIQMINEISLAIGCSCHTRKELYPRSEESKNGHLIFITGIVNSKSHPPTFRKFTDCFLTPPQTDFFAFDLTLMCRFNNGYIA